MKAKVIKTGEIIEVEDRQIFSMTADEEYRKGLNGKFYKLSELDFNLHTPQKIVIEGWITRDRDESLQFHQSKPTKGKHYWEAPTDRPIGESMLVYSDSFPSVNWEDSEPRKATITLTIIDEKGGE